MASSVKSGRGFRRWDVTGLPCNTLLPSVFAHNFRDDRHGRGRRKRGKTGGTMRVLTLLSLLIAGVVVVREAQSATLSGIITQGGNTLPVATIETAIEGIFATQLLFYNWCDVTSVASELVSVWNSGSIPVVTVMWYACNATSTNWVVADISAGLYDSVMQTWGSIVRDFAVPSPSNPLGRRIYLRPGHEMNGNWYPWGFQNYTFTPPSVFQNAFQRFSATVRNASGATSLQLQIIFCVNDRSAHNGWIPNPDVAPWYPGDAAVDWVGIDGYNTPAYANGEWWNVSFIFTEPIANVRSITSKPIGITETGCDDENNPALMPKKGLWLTQLCTLLSVENVKMLLYFNVEKFEQTSFHYWAVASSTYQDFSTPDYYTEWLECMQPRTAKSGPWVMSSGSGLLVNDSAFLGLL